MLSEAAAQRPGVGGVFWGVHVINNYNSSSSNNDTATTTTTTKINTNTYNNNNNNRTTRSARCVAACQPSISWRRWT